MINKGSLINVSKNREILISEENYAYYLPCEGLRSLVSNFTLTFPDKSIITDEYTVMPHGSATIVLFKYKAELYNFLFGPTTKPVKVGNIANKCDVIFIIEFQPAGFVPFIKVNQKELADKIVPFSLIDNSLDKTMKNIILTSSSADEVLLDFEKELITNIRFPYPKELEAAIKNIVQRKGIMKVEDISNNAFYSPRHLNRLFNLYLGMSIKSFARLVRINKSIQLLNDKTMTLDSICESLGYYDNSHFVKDFKVICDITPQKYRSNMSDFYSEIAKF